MAFRSVLPLLAGSWRRVLDPIPANFTLLGVPTLVAGNIGSLVWKRIEKSSTGRTRSGRALHDHYLRWVMESHQLAGFVRYFIDTAREAGIEPIIVKGWAIARLYPELGMRPYSDIDLCVAPSHLGDAEQAFRRKPLPGGMLDLHGGVADLDDRTWPEIMARTQLVPCRNTLVRVLGPEDQLRQLCLHFWRHLGMKPIWLVDIACAMEASESDFDWDYCLHGDSVRTDWVRCTLGLAQRLLGAKCPHAALWQDAHRLPAWLAPSVLWRWERVLHLPTWRHYRRHPRHVADAVRYQWLNPIRATIRTHQRATRSQAITQTLATLQRPVQLTIRLGRCLTKIRTGGTPETVYDIHRERTF